MGFLIQPIRFSPSKDHKRQCPNVEKTCLFCSGKYKRASESQHLENCLAYWKHMAASYKKKAEELELEVQNLNDGLGERTSSGKLKKQRWWSNFISLFFQENKGLHRILALLFWAPILIMKTFLPLLSNLMLVRAHLLNL